VTTYASLTKLMADEGNREKFWVTPSGKRVHRRFAGFGGGIGATLCGLHVDNWRLLDWGFTLAQKPRERPLPCASCFPEGPVRVTFYYH
jgi:hypothetical protein